MDANSGAATENMNNFEPSSDWIQEEECDTLLIYLPGFTKEQLRVQLTRTGALKISGTRPLGNNRWSIFEKEFPVSANCDTKQITAKFEGGILYVRQPKLIVPAEKKDLKIPQPQTPTADPPAPKINQEQATTQKTTPSDDQHRQTSAKDFLERKTQETEAKSTKKEKSSESKGAKRDQDVKKKSGSTDDDQKAAATTMSDKREEVSGHIDAESANKGTNRNAKAKVDDYKLDAGSPAAKLKMARQRMTMVLVILFAFAIGMYISNLAWFSKKVEN